MNMLGQSAIFLGAAVIAVPLSRKAGLGALLGYLMAGMAIGPYVFGLISEVDDVLHFAELGVVLLLFVIGLELKPARLWAMRKPVFGLGSLQMLVTTILLFGISIAFGLTWKPALIVALGLSLSSTAVALQMLAEKNQLLDAHGRASFGILLFQDLAIVPVMALVPLMVSETGGADTSMWLSSLKMVGALLAVIVGGRYLLRPVFRIIAATKVREVFTATALLLVVGTGLLMQAVGFSMAMGAFLAGVLLADSEYRHELEADIEPFKGLLLGLFFIAVGMSVNLRLVFSTPLLVLGLTALFLAVKFTVLWVLGRGYGLNAFQSSRLGMTVFQGGEFAFVIFGLAGAKQLIGMPTIELLILVVSLSMMLTPIIGIVCDRYFRVSQEDAPEFDQMEDEENKIIIAGFGRVGQIVGRLMSVQKIPFTALDINPVHVDFVRNFGNKIHYGDARRLELLHAAGADSAKVFIVALANVEASLEVTKMVKKHFPHLKIFVRARNRQHVFEIMDLGVTRFTRDTFLSSLEIGEQVLHALGVPVSKAATTVARFKDYDRELLKHQHTIHRDMDKMMMVGRHSRKQLEELFEKDTELLMSEINTSSKK